MKKTLLLAVAVVFCIICAAAAGCITINVPPDTNPATVPTGTPVPVPEGPGPVINVVPGEWEGVLVNDDGTQVEYKIDCAYGGSAKLEIDARTGVMDKERTYYGTWTETKTASYRLVFDAVGTYTFVMNNDGTGTLTTPESKTVTLLPDADNAVLYDPVAGEWDGVLTKSDGTRVEYKLEFLRSGTVAIEVETTAPLSYETEVKSYGTWTKTADNVYTISVPNTAGYTMTLSSNSAATLSTPDNGTVSLVRDY
ncbi:hypothetical protein [Methanocorpusculum vombati]|uniref:Uncharacterized protein n=1 Tax=Methanocorpusculum vombati TaxID=3002864 RepID=A0ABT4IPI1_9EURY|nr:hypothetical protein [Methanocorpusculum vombati]MCZ9319009.1 hypothetical protein [Methanocorpusculum sp.]MCZ0863461.1 hypothetical protein [Methanocorpusculum vombati]MDE2519885.1 hypothetical protein [Methanocorpusculum sp.]MDE2546162.1 hypothetical protein [Methanocorpusculum sp.]MDE2547817.1 hypothetical protein [Methanocorpusculum sp.]